MQATLEALSHEMAHNPRIFVLGRRHRQTRRQLQDHRRPLRSLRPRTPVRHAHLRTRLRRPRRRGGHDRNPTRHRFHVRRLRPRCRRRDHQSDRQDAVHERWPHQDADPAARLHRHRPFRGNASLRQLLSDVRPLSRPARRRPLDAVRRQGTACTTPCAATIPSCSSNIASCSPSRGRCPKSLTRFLSARRPWCAKARMSPSSPWR